MGRVAERRNLTWIFPTSREHWERLGHGKFEDSQSFHDPSDRLVLLTPEFPTETEVRCLYGAERRRPSGPPKAKGGNITQKVHHLPHHADDLEMELLQLFRVAKHKAAFLR